MNLLSPVLKDNDLAEMIIKLTNNGILPCSQPQIPTDTVDDVAKFVYEYCISLIPPEILNLKKVIKDSYDLKVDLIRHMKFNAKLTLLFEHDLGKTYSVSKFIYESVEYIHNENCVHNLNNYVDESHLTKQIQSILNFFNLPGKSPHIPLFLYPFTLFHFAERKNFAVWDNKKKYNYRNNLRHYIQFNNLLSKVQEDRGMAGNTVWTNVSSCYMDIQHYLYERAYNISLFSTIAKKIQAGKAGDKIEINEISQSYSPMALLPNVIGRKEIVEGFLENPSIIKNSQKELSYIIKQMGLFTIPVMNSLFYCFIKSKGFETEILSKNWYEPVSLLPINIDKVEVYQSLMDYYDKKLAPLDATVTLYKICNTLISEKSYLHEKIFKNI